MKIDPIVVLSLPNTRSNLFVFHFYDSVSLVLPMMLLSCVKVVTNQGAAN